ncbi:MAG: hypothetical protein Q8L23_10170 [Caulobacter sp.]|nr:hypothetical protein [Caulobacter sp.]
MSARPVQSADGYARRLALVYALALVGALAWIPLNALYPNWMSDNLPGFFTYLGALALAPIPAVAAATLLVWDYGWRRGLLGAPAAVLAVTGAGVCNVVRIAIEDGSFL